MFTDNGKEAREAMNEVSKYDKLYTKATHHLNRYEAIQEVFNNIEYVNQNTNLSKDSSKSYTIRALYEIINIYSDFLDIISEKHPDIMDDFFEEKTVSREHKH